MLRVSTFLSGRHAVIMTHLVAMLVNEDGATLLPILGTIAISCMVDFMIASTSPPDEVDVFLLVRLHGFELVLFQLAAFIHRIAELYLFSLQLELFSLLLLLCHHDLEILLAIASSGLVLFFELTLSDPLRWLLLLFPLSGCLLQSILLWCRRRHRQSHDDIPYQILQ